MPNRTRIPSNFALQMNTKTLEDQQNVEKSVMQIYAKISQSRDVFESLTLKREKHIRYLYKGLNFLPSGFLTLDASRPWLCYWIIHSLSLLGENLPENLASRCVETLKSCQDSNGGFGGGPGQLPHLATTYAAVCALVSIGGFQALDAINRKAMLDFLLRMKNSDGSFRLHEDGEVDVRGTYTALAIAHLLNLKSPQLFSNVGKYVKSCQTFEGGISGVPEMEAHGGYTFCGLAATILAGQHEDLNLPLLLDWAVSCQKKVEGGFHGRTNKLVDGCYSFWMGGIFALLEKVSQSLVGQLGISGRIEKNLVEEEEEVTSSGSTVENSSKSESTTGANSTSGESLEYFISDLKDPLFNSKSLQGYILLCCQDKEGGLIDKPGKPRDFYHTCYCLSGLSTAQHIGTKVDCLVKSEKIVGPYRANLLERTEPICNVVLHKYIEAIDFYSSLNA